MRSIEIKLPAHVVTVLEHLENKGHEAYCVGGCVRDALLHRIPSDWDVTTSALPEQIKTCFSSFRTVDTGIQHGTVTVWLQGHPVEITTYRTEGSYSDSRHPDYVRFSSSLQEDLSRRDFTVNALAYHPQRGLVDFFFGQEDLEHSILRCVGDPVLRFSEDALRILRALRFSSVLGFTIETATAQACFTLKELLTRLSRERIREELTRLLCGAQAARILREYRQLLFVILPALAPMDGCEQQHPCHCFDVWEHTLHTVENSPPDAVSRWAALLHDSAKPACKSHSADGIDHFYGHASASAALAQDVLQELRFSTREIQQIISLVRYHNEPLPLPPVRIKKLLGKLGDTLFFQLLSLQRADCLAQAPALLAERARYLEDAHLTAKKLLTTASCLSLKELQITGSDLMSIGFSQDKGLGDTLHWLLEEVLAERLPNQHTVLLEQARGKRKEPSQNA